MNMTTVFWAAVVVGYLLLITTDAAWKFLLYLVCIGGVAYVPFSIVFGKNGRSYQHSRRRSGRRGSW